MRLITSAHSRNSRGKVRKEAADDLLALVCANLTNKDRQLFKSCVN
jgi:hypothetical protein